MSCALSVWAEPLFGKPVPERLRVYEPDTQRLNYEVILRQRVLMFPSLCVLMFPSLCMVLWLHLNAIVVEHAASIPPCLFIELIISELLPCPNGCIHPAVSVHRTKALFTFLP